MFNKTETLNSVISTPSISRFFCDKSIHYRQHYSTMRPWSFWSFGFNTAQPVTHVVRNISAKHEVHFQLKSVLDAQTDRQTDRQAAMLNVSPIGQRHNNYTWHYITFCLNGHKVKSVICQRILREETKWTQRVNQCINMHHLHAKTYSWFSTLKCFK